MWKDKKFRLALVTGATSGIGEALCYLLAEKGVQLIIAGRNGSKLSAIKSNVVKTVQGDLSKKEDRSALAKVIVEMAPDLVINNAGFGLYGNALDYPIEEQLKLLEVNGNAYLELTLTTIQTLLKNNKPGTILNVSSAAADYIFPGFSVYAASKTFVNSFSESLDFEYRDRGIRVLTACPGFIKTNFGERAAGHPVRVKNKIEGMDVSFAAEEIWRQIQKGQPIHIFNAKYRLAAALAHFIPKRWLAPFLYREMLAKKHA